MSKCKLWRRNKEKKIETNAETVGKKKENKKSSRETKRELNVNRGKMDRLPRRKLRSKASILVRDLPSF